MHPSPACKTAMRSCVALDWLLDAIEVHNCDLRRKAFIPPSQQLEHAELAFLCDEMSNGRCQASRWLGSRKRHAEGTFHKGQAAID